MNVVPQKPVPDIEKNITTSMKQVVFRVTMVFIESEYMDYHSAITATHYGHVIMWLR